MKFRSLKSKLLLSVFTLVLASGLLISLLVTHRYSQTLFDSVVSQGHYLSRTVALESTDLILINDLVGLQKLLNIQQETTTDIAYLFVIRDGQILAHTFPEGFPVELVGANVIQNDDTGRFVRVTSGTGDHFLDFAWPVFSNKAGTLRLGFSEAPLRKRIKNLWLQMTSATLAILIVSLAASFLFIRRFTRPLSVLTEAAETVDAGNLNFSVTITEGDEIGRLANSFEQMVGRIKRHTQMLECKTAELDRTQHQMRTTFDIIQKIGAQVDLTGVCSYLTQKFDEMLVCRRFAFFFFSEEPAVVFSFADDRLRAFSNDHLGDELTEIHRIQKRERISRLSLSPPVVPEDVAAASKWTVLPFFHEGRKTGVLLVACSNTCQCEAAELDVIELILDQTAGAIRRAVIQEEDVCRFQDCIEYSSEYSGIVGKDPKMKTLYKLIEDISASDATVLIQGESGTGKELVARAIHQKGLRKKKPFIVINCSAYPATLIESELFGHNKGAFTGAVRQKPGRFEQADGGTVLLDEIGDIPPAAQVKLLRVLQTQKFERLGGETTLHVDVRIISATNKELLQEVKRGNFREDLYYRLNVIPVHIPPLRDRRNDIPLLARHFLKRFAAEQGKTVLDFTTEAMRSLLGYSWPGNVRELENSVEHAVVLAKEDLVERNDLPPSMLTFKPPPRKRSSKTMTESEAKLLQEVLDDCGWNKKEAAKRLGISRSTLYNKIKKYGISPPTIH